MRKSWIDNIRRIDLAVDYSHETDQRAAAWFKGVELSEDGEELWMIPDWTKDGAKSVGEKEFRYISADFQFNYRDNESGINHGTVLLGAGLTNRPVIKGMTPAIQLQENNNILQGNNTMDLKEATDKIAAMQTEIEQLKIGRVKLQEFDMTPQAMQTRISDLEGQLATMKTQNEQMTDDKRLAEKTAQFNVLLSEGGACPAQKDAYLNGKMDEFIKLAEKVNLVEKGKGGNGEDNGDTKENKENKDADPSDEVMKLAEEKMKDKDKFNDLGDAISVVLSENPKLRDKYEKSVAV